jgi:elongation factor Ts
MTTNIISAALVKELRDITSAGMMECKKALAATNGDLDKAIEELRKSGAAKAGKKAGRIAAEGIVVIADNGKQAVMVEVNCETDFVGRDANFTSFAKAVAETALANEADDAVVLAGLPLHGHISHTVEQARQELVTKIGENVQIRRLVKTGSTAAGTGIYIHGGRIGVVVELDVDNKELARDVAMHIAASRPLVVTPDHVSQDLIAKEKEIFIAQAASSGKPQDIIEKMVAGRVKKYLDEISLVGQPFVKDPDVTVGGLLGKHRATVLAFHRYEVGEGIEKVTEDFKEAVMAQVNSG